MSRSVAAVLILTLPAALNLPAPRYANKRSPLDITPFDELPTLLIPSNHHAVPIALAPILAPRHVVRLHHGDNPFDKGKGANFEHATHHLHSPLLYPLAMSNIQKISVHPEVKQLITSDNLKIPIITHTIVQSSSNVTHPLKAVLVPIHSIQGVLVPLSKPLVLLHDTSVIPLRTDNFLKHPEVHSQNLVSTSRQDRQLSESITADSKDDNDEERDPIGGFGNGFKFGGHGAGHGFFAFG